MPGGTRVAGRAAGVGEAAIAELRIQGPPPLVLLASLFLLALGASTGGALVRLQDWFYTRARLEVVKRPEVHGFAGVEVIDEQKITEIVEQSNRAFRMLHVHSLGVGLLVLTSGTLIANLPLPRGWRRLFTTLVALGALYPPGWLLFGALIPFYGFPALRGPIEYGVMLPFGGAAIAGLWGALLAYGVVLARGGRR